jgi:hypothetical protein
MTKKNYFCVLRAVSMVILISGLLMPWFRLGFEPHPTPFRLTGFEDIWNSGSLGSELIFKYGPDLYSVFLLLEGLSGIFLLLYLIYNTFAMIRTSKGNKILSVLLIINSFIFLFNSHSFIIEKVLSGFWLCIVSLLSFAIIEYFN